jgi:hypothetical protein
MEPATMLAIMGGAQLAGGLLGQSAARSERAAADRARQQALQLFQSIQTPDIKDQQVSLDRFQLQGLLSNLLEQSPETLGESQLSQIEIDPRLRQAQMRALETLQQQGAVGLTPEEQAQATRMRQESQAQEAARQASILQNMQARGVAGSGVEAAARLGSSQQMANAEARSADELRALAFNRMLQATAQSGDLGSRMEANQYQQMSNAARAEDEIARFNLAQRAETLRRNTDRQRAVEAANLAARQQTANANTGLANQQQMYNTGLIQQRFQNELQRAGGMTGQLSGIAQSRDDAATATGKMYGDIASSVGSAFSKYLSSSGDKKDGG